MNWLMKNKAISIAILVIIGSVFLLVHANSKSADCESLGGKLIQVFDSVSRQGCAQVLTMQVISFAGLAIGIAFLIIGFVRRE
ncbi:MAG: hypothetical protein ABIA62_05175 [Candidatus Woesearchaeota archaeon]